MVHTLRLHSPAEAGEIIRNGGLVAFPTETVFGLGADATNPQAVERIFIAKGRPSNNPLIVHLNAVNAWPQAAACLPPTAARLMAHLSPGPLTVVLPKHPEICPQVTTGLPTVGIRIPKHELASDVLRAARVPVAAPSANLSGSPSGTTWRSVLDDLEGRIDAILCVDSPAIGLESTVVDCTSANPRVLRPGAITFEQLQTLLPNIHPYSPADHTQVNSPGLLHPHYQPRASVQLIATEQEIVTAFQNIIPQQLAYCGYHELNVDLKCAHSQIFESLESYAAGFYEFLREADRRGAQHILIQLAAPHALGQALRDRQLRAAGWAYPPATA